MENLYLPVYKVVAEGVAVPYFEPWQEWVKRAPVFGLLGLRLDDLVFFFDSVTASAVGDCALCVFDCYYGDLVAFADGGLVAAVREARY